MYLEPFKPPSHPSGWYEISDTIATWGMFAAVLVLLYFDYKTYQRGTPQWPREE